MHIYARDVEINNANDDLSMFTKARTIESTSPTLLKLVAEFLEKSYYPCVQAPWIKI